MAGDNYPDLPPGVGVPTLDLATNRLPPVVEEAIATAPALQEEFAQHPRTTDKPVGQNELLFNVADYGAKLNGVDDDNAAIEATLAAIIASGAGSAFGPAGILYIPAGRFIDSGQHLIPVGRKIVVRGSGRASTEGRRANGSVGNWWTFDAAESGIEHLTLDGRRYQCPLGGANIVLTGAYTFVDDVFVNKAQGDGILIGRNEGPGGVPAKGAAVVHSLTRVRVRECYSYGIFVVGGTESTDGIWSGVEVGLCGRSGVRIDTGSQNIANLHVWGCGLEDAADRSGVWLNSQSSTLVNVQSETNNGFGVYVTGARNVIVGGRVWGNNSSGLRAVGANYLVVTGVEFYRNAAANSVAGATSPAFSAMYLTDTSYSTVTGCNVWDDATAFSAVAYVTAPTYPFPGRTAARSMVYGIAEDGTSDYNTYGSNTAPKETLRTSSGPFAFVGNNNVIQGNQWGAGVTVPTRAVVGTAVRVPQETDVIYVTAAATITSVLGHRAGRRVTLLFTTPGTGGSVTDDGDVLNLAGNLALAPGVTLSLVSDGAKWREVSRSTL